MPVWSIGPILLRFEREKKTFQVLSVQKKRLEEPLNQLIFGDSGISASHFYP